MQAEWEIILEKVRLCLSTYIPKNQFEDIQVSEYEIYGEIIIRAFKTILVHVINNSRIYHPEDWKEAFKERWFPDWLKKKYPVKYKIYDAYMIFPDMIKKYKPKDGKIYLSYKEK